MNFPFGLFVAFVFSRFVIHAAEVPAPDVLPLATAEPAAVSASAAARISAAPSLPLVSASVLFRFFR